MKRFIFFFISILLAGSVAKAETWVIAADGGYEPWTDPALPGGGIAIEVVRQAMALEGDKVEVIWVPWKRAKQMVLGREVDGSTPWSITEERKKQFLYSDSYITWGTALVSHDPSLISLTGAPDKFKNKKLCMPQGWKVPDVLKPMVDDKVLTLVQPQKNKVECIVLCRLGRVDLFTVTYIQYETLHKQAQSKIDELSEGQKSSLRTLTVSEPLDIPDDLGAVITELNNPRGKRFIDKFNKNLRKLKENGTFDELYLKYYGIKNSEEVLNKQTSVTNRASQELIP